MMREKRWRRVHFRCPMQILALALLGVGCVNTSQMLPRECIAQSPEVLIEITTKQVECSPALAAWEREVARRCGWLEEDDFDE